MEELEGIRDISNCSSLYPARENARTKVSFSFFFSSDFDSVLDPRIVSTQMKLTEEDGGEAEGNKTKALYEGSVIKGFRNILADKQTL